MPRPISVLAAILCLLAPPVARATSCGDAAHRAELEAGLPGGLLAAIGSVESGGWSWSVNGNTGLPGQRFSSEAEAERYTETLLGAGRMVDVGCFQVDLHYHPDAFARWQDGFDGDANARAAAAILNDLHLQTGDWQRAVALYHSADPVRGASYLQAVMSAWHGGGALFSPADASDALHVIALRSVVIPVTVWTPGAGGRPQPMRGGRPGGRVSQRLPHVITP